MQFSAVVIVKFSYNAPLYLNKTKKEQEVYTQTLFNYRYLYWIEGFSNVNSYYILLLLVSKEL